MVKVKIQFDAVFFTVIQTVQINRDEKPSSVVRNFQNGVYLTSLNKDSPILELTDEGLNQIGEILTIEFIHDIPFSRFKGLYEYELIGFYPKRRIGDIACYDSNLNENNFYWMSDGQIIPKEFQPDITPELFKYKMD